MSTLELTPHLKTLPVARLSHKKHSHLPAPYAPIHSRINRWPYNQAPSPYHQCGDLTSFADFLSTIALILHLKTLNHQNIVTKTTLARPPTIPSICAPAFGHTNKPAPCPMHATTSTPRQISCSHYSGHCTQRQSSIKQPSQKQHCPIPRAPVHLRTGLRPYNQARFAYHQCHNLPSPTRFWSILTPPPLPRTTLTLPPTLPCTRSTSLSI